MLIVVVFLIIVSVKTGATKTRYRSNPSLISRVGRQTILCHAWQTVFFLPNTGMSRSLVFHSTQGLAVEVHIYAQDTRTRMHVYKAGHTHTRTHTHTHTKLTTHTERETERERERQRERMQLMDAL